MFIIIMGCGRVGSYLATRLDREGHQVTVIDLTANAFRRLSEDFRGQTVVGTGIDEHVLRMAGIEGADAFIAVTEGDNRNIMAAQVAREITNGHGADIVYNTVGSAYWEAANKSLAKRGTQIFAGAGLQARRVGIGDEIAQLLQGDLVAVDPADEVVAVRHQVGAGGQGIGGGVAGGLAEGGPG